MLPWVAQQCSLLEALQTGLPPGRAPAQILARMQREQVIAAPHCPQQILCSIFLPSYFLTSMNLEMQEPYFTYDYYRNILAL